jgi:hypothetical protein
MQNRKEDFIEFVKTIKKKVRDWWVSYNRKLWTTRIFVYGFLLLLAIFVGAVIFAKFNLFHTDAGSARYMLSALVQTQAAIVAIVITLTLIAVQLTASAYSPRVIDIFKKNPDMWILLGFYGASIFYGFIVLKLVEGAEGEAVSQIAIWSLGRVSVSLESYVSLAYWLGAFTFVALFPYMLNIISLLKSENIINRLAIEITKGKILNLKEDPIQPIMDIIHGSIMKYDIETARVGLRAVTKRVLEIDFVKEDYENMEKISHRFCFPLIRAGRLAVSREDEELTLEVIESLEDFGVSIAEKELVATGGVVYALHDVGKAAVEKGLEDATEKAVGSLEAVGLTAVEKGKVLGNATLEAIECLEAIGKAAAVKEFEDVIEKVARSFVIIGTIATEKGLERATLQAAKSLAKLTILNEKILKTAICDFCDLELIFWEEKERDASKKFIKIYEQELEELRAEKR